MPGATLDPGDELTRLNKGVGGRPPGQGGSGGSGGPVDPKRGLLTQIGAVLTASAQRRFKDQRFGPAEWLPRAVPNIPGVISDADRGAEIKSRRFEPRPANVDTGRLRASLTWRLIDDFTLEVGSNLSYAGDAQYGGEIRIRVTDRAKQGIAAFLKKNAQWEKALGFLTDPDLEYYESERPERIFVGVDDKDAQKIERIIERWFGNGTFEVG